MPPETDGAKVFAMWDNQGMADSNSKLRKRPRDPAQLAKLMIDIASGEVEDREPTPEELGKDPAAAALGRKGGAARAKSMSAEKRAEIAKRAAKSRWNKSKTSS
jgi:hypothetical protein